MEENEDVNRVPAFTTDKNVRERESAMKDNWELLAGRRFPGLSDTELREVQESFHKYAIVAWRIFERLNRGLTVDFDDSEDVQ